MGVSVANSLKFCLVEKTHRASCTHMADRIGFG